MADLHSWRQSDTASVARNLTRSNYDVLHPQIDSAVSIDGIGRDNTFRYHFAEFPIYQLFTAYVSNLTGDIVTAGRIVSIVASLISIVFLYLLTRRYFSEKVALTAAFVYGSLPYAIFWSRAVLPDATMLMFCLGTLYFFDKWVRDSKVSNKIVSELLNVNLLLATVFFALALIMKVFVPFLLLPMLYQVCLRYSANIWKISLVGLTFMSVIPLFDKIRTSQPFRPASQVIQIMSEGGHLPLKLLVVSLLVLGLYLLFRFRNEFLKIKIFVILIAVAAIPFGLWRVWMQEWPMSIPASGWLFDGNRIRFKPAWWHWIFQSRLDTYMFNFPGLLFIGLALLQWKSVYQSLRNSGEGILGKIKAKIIVEKDQTWYWPLVMLSCLLYLVVFATGNVQHEYYQLPMTAFGSVFVSLGFWYVWSLDGGKFEVWLRRLSSLGLIGLMILLSWYSVRDWYGIGNPLMVEVGKRADRILPTDAKVVADYGGDTTFLYYINRQGWSVRDKQIDEMIDRGATHYISLHRDEYINKMARLYKIVDETPEYVMMDLREKTDNLEWENIGRYEL
jgi:hypothetical protein